MSLRVKAGGILIVWLANLAIGSTALAPDEFSVESTLSEPAQVVAGLHYELINVMQSASELGFAGRYQRFAGIIPTTHDLSYIGRVAIGRHWRDLTDDQRRRYIEAFSELSVVIYASRFDGYTNQHFEVIEEIALPRERIKIKGNLIIRSGEDHQFEYLLHQREGQWRIINIVVDGVSDLALKRSVYASVIRRKGVSGLITTLEESISELSEP